jgi:hypothetical protein
MSQGKQIEMVLWQNPNKLKIPLGVEKGHSVKIILSVTIGILNQLP